MIECKLLTEWQLISLWRLQGRFAGHVFPGETLETRMWVDYPHTVIFQARVCERGTLAITNAAVTFQPGVKLAATAAAKL